VNLIYPGSFDPFHRGHADVIRRIYDNIDVNNLIVLLQPNVFKSMPMFNNTFKFDYLESSIKDAFPTYNIHVSFTTECRFSTYWLITGLDSLKYKLVVGDDCLSSIHEWKDFKLMTSRGLELVVVQRDLSYREIEGFKDTLSIISIISHDSQSISNTRNVSSTVIRNEINQILNKYGRENVDQ